MQPLAVSDQPKAVKKRVKLCVCVYVYVCACNVKREAEIKRDMRCRAATVIAPSEFVN